MPLVYLKELITAYDLLKRWEKEVTEERLASLMRNKALQAYRMPSPPVLRKPGDQHDAYELWEGAPGKALLHDFFDISEGKTCYDFSNFVFNMTDVVAYEVKHFGQDTPPQMISAEAPTECTQTVTPSKARTKNHGYKENMECTQTFAALACTVSVRTIQNWESDGYGPPVGYPGRTNKKKLEQWAASYRKLKEEQEIANRLKLGRKKTSTMDPNYAGTLAGKSEYNNEG